MRSILLGAMAAVGIASASPAFAQNNYLFGFSNGTELRQLELQTSTGVFTLNALDSGWYFQSGFHGASNNNYIVGECTVSCSRQGFYNDYFTFDLASVTGTITAATLSAFNPDYVSGILSTWSVWDVGTSIPLLDVNRADGDLTGIGIFADLQSGTLFGSRSVTGVVDGTVVSVDLNGNALSALNAGIGSQFAIGGTLRAGRVIPGIPGGVPEPSTWAMMLLGFGLVGGAMRSAKRRQRRSAAFA